MSKPFGILLISFGMSLLVAANCLAQARDSTQIVVRKTDDFQVSGTGDNNQWETTDWVLITSQKAAKKPLRTQAKILYSTTGIYCLFQCEDEKLTATIQEDFGALYTEDVVEIFLWPDPSVPIYFEYELSPLNYELAILVPNLNGKFYGWKPWHHNSATAVKHATSIQGGDKISGASIKGWTAEFFIPYRLMRPLVETPPTTGTKWRGNLYRIDYDQGYATWSWQKTGGSFHEFAKFGTLIFD